MNVFEFLGLSADHRPNSKVVQLVKHFDEVSGSRKKFPYYVQIKMDGVFCMVVRTGAKFAIFGRTGKALTNVSHILDKHYPRKDGVFIGELCCDECSLEVLSGIVNPNRTKALSESQEALLSKFVIWFHDFVSIDDFIKGEAPVKYPTRWMVAAESFPFSTLNYGMAHSEEEIRSLAEAYIAKGAEGIVIKNYEAGWVAGHKGLHAMKIVRGVDYDLLCIGFEEGKGKYSGKVANLLFKWRDGQTVKAMLGKGWTHEDAEKLLRYATYGKDVGMPEYEHVESPVGKIYHLHALQESSKGKLRLPKVCEQRIDKEIPDVG